MSLALSAVLFAVFGINVATGAITHQPFMGDVGEMLVLLAASLFFVVAILKKEADRKQESSGKPTGRT